MTYNLKKFRHAEVLNFLSDELEELKPLGLSKISPKIDRMQSLIPIYLSGLGRPRYVSNPLNREFQEVRRQVQSEFSRLNQLVRAYCLRREEDAVASAAQKVREMLVGFRGATKRAYRAQIELCKRALELLEKELRTEVEVLNLSGLVASLGDLVVTEEILFEQKVLDMKPKPIPMKEIRAELSLLYAEVMQYVRAVDLVMPSEAVSAYLKHHEARWTEMNETALRRRRGQRASLARRRAELRELALACGWQLPEGVADFTYFGSVRILHPTERRWYGLEEVEGQPALVLLPTKKAVQITQTKDYQPIDKTLLDKAKFPAFKLAHPSAGNKINSPSPPILREDVTFFTANPAPSTSVCQE